MNTAIAIGAMALVLIVAIVLYGVAKGKGGEDRQAKKSLEKGAKKQEKGDVVLAEPIADERSWVRRARDRYRKLHDDDA